MWVKNLRFRIISTRFDPFLCLPIVVGRLVLRTGEMERGRQIKWPWRLTAVLAVTTALSCGTGIRTVEGEVEVSKIIDKDGFDLKLGEATLNVKKDCLDGPALIILRRFHTYDHHPGAVGPVFEIEIPTFDTFKQDPRIVIETLPTTAISKSSFIGFLVPGVDNEQWVPDSVDSTKADPPCSPPDICGPVQLLGFPQPDSSAASQASRLDYAIVKKCQDISECGLNQACSASACQECATSGPCNRVLP
jgi:hypothetical protein